VAKQLEKVDLIADLAPSGGHVASINIQKAEDSELITQIGIAT
jgi:hypothetical protein